jgi:tRNA pseudouridine-54 N-methylase
MKTKHKLLARVVEVREISSFELEEGEKLNERVATEIKKATESGQLDKMATRVGLPSLSVATVDEGESLAGGETLSSTDLFAPDGSPLVHRHFTVEATESGAFILTGHDNEVEEKIDVIGVFTKESVAEQIGLFWRNGHLYIPS